MDAPIDSACAMLLLPLLLPLAPPLLLLATALLPLKLSILSSGPCDDPSMLASAAAWSDLLANALVLRGGGSAAAVRTASASWMPRRSRLMSVSGVPRSPRRVEPKLSPASLLTTQVLSAPASRSLAACLFLGHRHSSTKQTHCSES
jgi:hypothetical protein